MARRRQVAEPTTAPGATPPRTPEEVAAWIAPGEVLPCDRSDWLPARPCSTSGDQHDEWCRVFAARRRWYADRREHPQPPGMASGMPV